MNTAILTTSTNFQSYQQNVADCIKRTSQFGGTIYTNICNGQSSYVPNGGLDFLVYGVVILAALVFFVEILKIIFD